jgi:hypothetical protein
MDNAYSFRPYEKDDEWIVWVCVAPMLSIFPLFYDGEATLFQMIGFGLICLLFWFEAVLGIMEHCTDISVSYQGISVSRGKYDVVPLINWNTFACAYLLDVSWTDSDKAGFRNKRYASYYFIFTRNQLSDAEIIKFSSRLAKSKPLGKMKGHIVFRSNEQHNAAIRQCIAEKIPLVEIKKNAEGEISRV